MDIIPRISVTDLDRFRAYREDENFPLEVLLAQLRHQEPPTPAMEAGKAFHRMLETAPEEGEFRHADIDGHRFEFTLDGHIELTTIRELRGEKQYELPDGSRATLAGRVDGIRGRRVIDHKLSSRFDAERYADSYQWRAYLSIFGGVTFTYNVFVASDPVIFPEYTLHVIRDVHELTFYRYPEMENDLLREIGEISRFMKQHMLVPAALKETNEWPSNAQ